MDGSTIRLTVADGVAHQDLADTLSLAILAAEGIFGAAMVRTDVTYELNDHTIVVSSGTEAGRAVARIVAQFLSKAFGERSFRVASVSSNPASSALGVTA